MSDPNELPEEIAAAEDAFGHAYGQPTFEPTLNAEPDAEDGAVQIQKACRLLELTHRIEEIGDYYGAVLERSFVAIEQTFQGYLLVIAGTDPSELRNHDSPYEFAKGQVPLEDSTIQALKTLYENRRTEHYYGTTVATEAQAKRMRNIATTVHSHVVSFDHEIERYRNCTADQ